MRIPQVLLILIVLGAAARLCGTWLQPGDLTADHDGYLAHATMLVQGEGFAGPFSHRPTAFRPPAYPIVLAGLQWIGLQPPTSVAFVNCCCSLAIIGLTWILCGQLQLPPNVSFLATTMTALDPLLLRYTILPMTEVPAAAMLIAAIVALRAADLRQEERGHTSAGMSVLSGMLFGLGSLVRPVLLVSCGMLVLRRVIHRQESGSRLRRHIAIAILPMVLAIVTLSPWIIRNAAQFHRFVPSTTHGGYTLALGNNADFYRDVIDGDVSFPWPGPQLDAWQQRMIAESAAEGVPVGDEPAQDAWYYQQAISSIKAQPLSFLKACLLRLRRFCAVTPGADAGLPGMVSILIAIWYSLTGFGVISSICRLTPVFRGPQRTCVPELIHQNPGLADLWLVLFSFMLLHTVYWTDTRMRAPVMPVICIISAVGWQWLYGSICNRFHPKITPEPQP
ncbi:MAG: hypothetical protein O2856_14530 [Planctomycetota bacterium]|nr:hypothetical protein [Planctomycetota bacterium]